LDRTREWRNLPELLKFIILTVNSFYTNVPSEKEEEGRSDFCWHLTQLVCVEHTVPSGFPSVPPSETQFLLGLRAFLGWGGLSLGFQVAWEGCSSPPGLLVAKETELAGIETSPSRMNKCPPEMLELVCLVQ